MNEVKVLNQTQAPVVQSQQQAGFLGLIEKALLMPTPDFTVIDKMLDMQERILAKEAEMKFNQAFSVMINEIPIVAETSSANMQTKAGGRIGYSYSKFNEIVEIVRPILSRHGFAVNFKHEQDFQQGGLAGSVKICCVLRHNAGHSIENSMILPVDNSGAKNAVQGIGSTVTYGKRYTLCSMLNIATGDDKDGHTVKASEANRKMKLSDERFASALQAVKNGKYNLSKLVVEYDLSADQFAQVDILLGESTKDKNDEK